MEIHIITCLENFGVFFVFLEGPKSMSTAPYGTGLKLVLGHARSAIFFFFFLAQATNSKLLSDDSQLLNEDVATPLNEIP